MLGKFGFRSVIAGGAIDGVICFIDSTAGRKKVLVSLCRGELVGGEPLLMFSGDSHNSGIGVLILGSDGPRVGGGRVSVVGRGPEGGVDSAGDGGPAVAGGRAGDGEQVGGVGFAWGVWAEEGEDDSY